MSFKEFDMAEIEEAKQKYRKEAEEKWGNGEAYKESVKRTSDYSGEDWARITAEAKDIYGRFIEAMDQTPDSKEAMALAQEWQDHITRNYYNCTDEILAGLAGMYTADERFRSNIDQYRPGLAEFMSKAILAKINNG